jgi:hypothetical protein
MAAKWHDARTPASHGPARDDGDPASAAFSSQVILGFIPDSGKVDSRLD